MPAVTFAQLRSIAEQAGHAPLTVRESRRGWSGICGCGFNSPRVPTSALATQALADHVNRVGNAAYNRLRASGHSEESILDRLSQLAG
jgi:hypothetical protein